MNLKNWRWIGLLGVVALGLLVAVALCPVLAWAGLTTYVRSEPSVIPTPIVAYDENAPAPSVVLAEPVLEWSGAGAWGDEEAARCKTLQVGAGGEMALGYCGGSLTVTSLNRPEFVEMLDRLTAFELKTDTDSLIFQGRGQLSDPAWQRAVLAWAHWAFGESWSGRACAACRTVLSWHLGPVVDETTQCGHLTVLDYGYAYAELRPCEGGTVTGQTNGWLETEEWVPLDEWLYGRSALYSGDDYLAGVGSQSMTDVERVELEELARKVYTRLSGSTLAEPTGSADGPAPAPLPTERGEGTPQIALEISLDPNIALGIEERYSKDTDNEMWRDWEPGFMVYTLTGYPLADRAGEARIFVYRVDALEADGEHSAANVANLRGLLQGKPEMGAYPEAGVEESVYSVPWLRPINARPMMHAGVEYLDFQNGSGLRYLTQYAQGLSVVNNAELTYTFQGLTQDGQIYIAVVLPVQHPDLLAGANDVPEDDGSVWTDVESNLRYMRKVAQVLDKAEPSSYTPDLSSLDALVRSINVRESHPLIADETAAIQQAMLAALAAQGWPTDNTRIEVQKVADGYARVAVFYDVIERPDLWGLGFAVYEQGAWRSWAFGSGMAQEHAEAAGIPRSVWPEVWLQPDPGSTGGNPFERLLGSAVPPASWDIRPCEGDAPFLCVSRGAVAVGSVELLTFPLERHQDLQSWLAEAGIPLGVVDSTRPEHTPAVKAVLGAHAEAYLVDLELDRQASYRPGYSFVPQPTEDIQIGTLPGLAYGFVGRDPAGRAFERWLNYAAFDNEALYIRGAFYADGMPGSFASDQDLLAFEPIWLEILSGLRLGGDAG